jgi:hypothetical protein
MTNSSDTEMYNEGPANLTEDENIIIQKEYLSTVNGNEEILQNTDSITNNLISPENAESCNLEPICPQNTVNENFPPYTLSVNEKKMVPISRFPFKIAKVVPMT